MFSLSTLKRHTIVSITKAIFSEFYIPQKWINLVMTIKVEEAKTDPITVNSDLRQGYSMSPVLFNLVFEKVIRETNIGPHNSLYEFSVELFLNGNDLVLIYKSHDCWRTHFGRLKEAAKNDSLQINIGKTEHIVLGGKYGTRIYF